MRVLFWSELYWPLIGGAEVFGSRLIAALRQRGHQFLVLTSHEQDGLPDDDELEGTPIRRLPFRAAIAGRDIGALGRVMREVATLVAAFGPDVVHVNGIGPSGLIHLRARRPSGLRTLLTLQQELLVRAGGESDRLAVEMLRSADWVVGCSEEVLRQARAAVPEIASRSSCIYNGVDLRRDELAMFPAEPRLLCLGRFVPAKGFDVAIEAFARAAPRMPGARLVIAGDGPEHASLVARAAADGVADRVDFLGWIDPADVPALIESATVVIMPSRREGLPITGLQAALAGRPIIATPVGGLPEIVTDGFNGIVIGRDDPGSLADAMVRIVTDPPIAAAMGAASRARAIERFRWDDTVDAYDRLYERVREVTTDAPVQ